MPTGQLDIQKFLPAPAAPTVTPQGAGGATTYGYKIVARGIAYRTTAASAQGITAVGNATLNVTNFNRVIWTNVPGNTGYDIYRSTGGGTPSSTGKIGTVSAGVTTLDDTGLTATGVAPTINTTGDGDPLYVGGCRDKSVQIAGTFVATVQVQGSMLQDEWIQDGSDFTAGGVQAVAESWEFLRIRETAYTSGAPRAVLGYSRR